MQYKPLFAPIVRVSSLTNLMHSSLAGYHHFIKRYLHIAIMLFVSLFLLNSYMLLLLLQKHQVHAAQQDIIDSLQMTSTIGSKYNSESHPLVLGAFDPGIELADGRAANLKRLLRKYNSPLYDSAEYMVMKADQYGYHYGLLFAIAMQESQGCKVIPPGSHNCWGYGIYGDKVTTFTSYEEAIDTVSAGIFKNYIQKGLVTPDDIMKKYTPGSNGSWASAVHFFFQKLEE